MICRAIRALAELPFAAGDWLISRTSIGGEIMPNITVDDLNNLHRVLAEVYTEEATR